MLIYIETIIIDNFIVDYIILYITAKSGKENLSPLRGVASSALGVVVAFLSLLPLPTVSLLLLKLAFSSAMVLCAFGFESFFPSLARFYFFTFAIGGCALGLLYLKSGVQSSLFEKINISVGGLAFAVFAGFLLCKKIVLHLSFKSSTADFCFVAVLQTSRVSLLLSAFVDTGNTLSHKFDTRGVCVAFWGDIKKIYPHCKKAGELLCTTANGDGVMEVIQIEKLVLYKKTPRGKQIHSLHKDVFLTISQAPLSANGKLLLPPPLVFAK